LRAGWWGGRAPKEILIPRVILNEPWYKIAEVRSISGMNHGDHAPFRSPGHARLLPAPEVTRRGLAGGRAPKTLDRGPPLTTLGHQSSLDTVLNVVDRLVPSRLNAPMITTAINAAINAYSIAVTARLSDLNAGTRFLIAANIMK